MGRNQKENARTTALNEIRVGDCERIRVVNKHRESVTAICRARMRSQRKTGHFHVAVDQVVDRLHEGAEIF